MISGYTGKGERILFGIALFFSLLVYGLIGFGIVSAVAGSSRINLENAQESYGESDFGEDEYLEEAPDEYEDFGAEEYDYSMNDQAASAAGAFGVAVAFAFYLILIVALVLGAHIIAVGHLMGNGVRVTERQYPELWALFGRAALELGVKKLPAFYLIESGGLLNAFATRLFTRSYVAIYADLAERLYEGDPDSVAFVVAHELVHVKRDHMLRNLLTLPAEVVPFLKPAWRRACEYSCDSGGALIAPVGAERGLALLAAGKKLSARLDVEAYLESFRAEKSIWKSIAELASSHPHLPKRVAAIRKSR